MEKRDWVLSGYGNLKSLSIKRKVLPIGCEATFLETIPSLNFHIIHTCFHRFSFRIILSISAVCQKRQHCLGVHMQL